MQNTTSTLLRRAGLLAGLACLSMICAAPVALAAADDEGAKSPPPQGREVTPPSGPRDAAPPRRGRDGAPPSDLLRGPRVRSGDDGPGQPFGTRPSPRRGEMAAPPIPPRMWFATLRELDVSDETRESVAELMGAFEKERARFDEENGTKIRELERAARLARQESGDDRAESVLKLREEITAIREKAPKVEAVQERIFALLTPDQQATMREQLKAIEERQREAMQRRLREREVQGMGPAGRPGRDGATPPRRPGADDMTAPRRPNRGAGADGAGEVRPNRGGTGDTDRPRRPVDDGQRQRRQRSGDGQTGG